MQPTFKWLEMKIWYDYYYFLSPSIVCGHISASPHTVLKMHKEYIWDLNQRIAENNRHSFFITLPTKLHYLIRQHNCSLYFKMWFREEKTLDPRCNEARFLKRLIRVFLHAKSLLLHGTEINYSFIENLDPLWGIQQGTLCIFTGLQD